MSYVLEQLFYLTWKAISESELSEAKVLMKKIEQINALIRQQIDLMKEDNKLLKFSKREIPQLISLDAGFDALGDTILISAARYGRKELVIALIEGKADINCRNFQGTTACMDAAASGHADITRILVEAGADYSIKNCQGRTALMEAASCGHVDALQVLMEKPTNKDLRDNSGFTALDLAVDGRHLSAVCFLLTQGFKGNTNTLYKMLCEHDQRDPSVLDALSILYQQETQKGDHKELNKDTYEALGKHIQKLTDLGKIRASMDEQIKDVLQKIDEATARIAPIEIVAMITDYAHPPLAGLSFFKADGIDNLLVDSKLMSEKRKRSRETDDGFQERKHGY